MAKRSAIAQYHAKLAEAQALAKGASKHLRSRAKELVTELEELNAAYEEMMGESLPEWSGEGAALRTRTRRGAGRATGTRTAATRKSGGKRGKRSPLKGAYAGKTIPEAVVAALGKNKKGLGPKEIAEKIGGNRNSISVAMNGMVKDGLIKRVGRGSYIAA